MSSSANITLAGSDRLDTEGGSMLLHHHLVQCRQCGRTVIKSRRPGNPPRMAVCASCWNVGLRERRRRALAHVPDFALDDVLDGNIEVRP